MLHEDARVLAEAFSAEQKRQLGIEQQRAPTDEAMWDSDPRATAWRKSELARARALGEYGNVQAIAAEVHDL